MTQPKAPWHIREILRLVWIIIAPPTMVVWFFIGLCSMQRLGRVLEKTGIGLQEQGW